MNEKGFLKWLNENKSQYHPNAYAFVLEALRYTQSYYKKPKHVKGQELLMGISRMAREKYGDLAYLVLEEWGIKEGRDFGNIVFHLVEVGEVKRPQMIASKILISTLI